MGTSHRKLIFVCLTGHTKGSFALLKEYFMLVLNAFSLNMLAVMPADITVIEVSAWYAAALLAENGLESAVGHDTTAAVFSSALGLEVPYNRATVALSPGSVVIVGQYSGPRLIEGTTELPEGATIKWLQVVVTS